MRSGPGRRRRAADASRDVAGPRVAVVAPRGGDGLALVLRAGQRLVLADIVAGDDGAIEVRRGGRRAQDVAGSEGERRRAEGADALGAHASVAVDLEIRHVGPQKLV